MSNKNRNRNPQQPQKDNSMPQADQDTAAQQAGAEQSAQSEKASQQAEQTGDDSVENLDGPTLKIGFEVPEERPAELTLASTEEDVAAMASWNTWQELSGVADLTDDQLIAKAQVRRAELIESLTEELAQLSKAPAVVDKGTADNSGRGNTKSFVHVDELAVKPEVAQVAAAVASTTVTSTAAKDALSVFQQLMERTEAAGTPPQKALVRSLKQYVERMAPGAPINRDEGAKQQQTLWMVLKGVVDNTDNLEFRKQWFIVLSFFNEHSGRRQVFNGHYVFRFADQWNRSPDDLAAMQRLINLIHLTSKPEERAQGLKQVDLDRSLALGFTPMGRQNLISFYKSN